MRVVSRGTWVTRSQQLSGEHRNERRIDRTERLKQKSTTTDQEGCTVPNVESSTFQPVEPSAPLFERPAMQQTVALCDSRRLFGDALSALMSREPDLVFVGQAADTTDAIRLIQERRPQLMLVDAWAFDLQSSEFLREAVASSPSTRIVLLADDPSFSGFEFAMAAGVVAVVHRQQPWATVSEALRLALRGQTYVAPELVARASQVAPAPASAEVPPPRPISRGLERLTARERQIFDLIVNGYKNQEIATLLGVSIKTVETHRASINRKLSVHSTGQMIRFAATQGLIPQMHEVAAPRRSEIQLAAAAPLSLEVPVAVAR